MENEMIREIVITNSKTNEKFAMQFDANRIKDSEAMHHLLCFVDPGEEYTVKFTNSLSVSKELFQF